jgi:hypothetical protein
MRSLLVGIGLIAVSLLLTQMLGELFEWNAIRSQNTQQDPLRTFQLTSHKVRRTSDA